jgi:mono/diheme cytochrome c family protein
MKAHGFASALFSCLLIFAPAALYAQTSADAKLVENPIFKKNCAKCHGRTAEGRHFGGPSLVSDKTKAASDDELREILANGKGRMPTYAGKLTPEEISTLVEQIRLLNTK